MDIFDHLENVKDKASFMTFVEALADEREQAEKMERENPVYYQLGGALDWQNGNISAFLRAGLECFEERPLKESVSAEPSWRGFAEFLYFGKIYE